MAQCPPAARPFNGISKNRNQGVVGAGASASARSATQPMADRIGKNHIFADTLMAPEEWNKR
jgi:hypothetical protein